MQSLSKFFNERPVESCPTMYKQLLIVLSSPNLSLENFKTLLSELSDVLPCILRQEKELLSTPLFQGHTGSQTIVSSTSPENDQERKIYLEGYFKRISQTVGEFGEDLPLLLQVLRQQF